MTRNEKKKYLGLAVLIIAIILTATSVKSGTGRLDCGSVLSGDWGSSSCEETLTTRLVLSGVVAVIGTAILITNSDSIRFKRFSIKDSHAKMETETQKFCSQCGEKLTVGAKFCSECGAAV